MSATLRPGVHPVAATGLRSEAMFWLTGEVLLKFECLAFRALSNQPRLVWTFRLFCLVRIYMCKMSTGPWSEPNSWNLVRRKEVVSVQIKLNLFLVVWTFRPFTGSSSSFRPSRVVVSFPSSTSNASTDVPSATENTYVCSLPQRSHVFCTKGQYIMKCWKQWINYSLLWLVFYCRLVAVVRYWQYNLCTTRTFKVLRWLWCCW